MTAERPASRRLDLDAEADASGVMDRLAVGREVQFRENDEWPQVLGVVTRIWPNGKYVSIRSDGRLFVRCIEAVTCCG